jgi:hypothetical protein
MAKAHSISPVAIKSVLLALIALVGCGTRNRSRELPAIGSVTSITVSRRSGSPKTTKITGKAAISGIVNFVDEHRSGWSKPWFGIPVPVVTAEFYDGSESKGSFGVGGYLFVTQRDGDFLSRSASPAEVLRFLELVSPHSNSSIVPTEREHVLGGDFKIITSVNELPNQLKSAPVALTKEPKLEMTDPCHALQLTDVIAEQGLPRRRLKFAEIFREQMFLHYEMGGRGHAYHLVVFANFPPESKLVWGETVPKAASTLAHLQMGVSIPLSPSISALTY